VLAAVLVCLFPCVASAQVTVFEQKNSETDPEDVRSLAFFGFLQPRFTWQQKDLRDPSNKVENSPGFSFRRSRLGAIARVDKIATLTTEIELTTSAMLGIDAFARLHPIPEAQLTVGQFRVPFSRQNLVQGYAHQLPDPAYFVEPKFIVDRDIGAQVGGDLLGGRATYALAMMNGHGPRVDKNLDDYFLLAGRVTVAPLGAFPRFESDVRSDEERARPLFYVGGGAMQNHVNETKLKRTYVGADGSFIYQGASLYGEFYYRRDAPENAAAKASGIAQVTARGFNVQAGYFPPFDYTRDHVELAVRFQQFDPNIETAEPSPGDDLTSSNPVQGFQGIGFGLNWFAHRGHGAKIQAYYELRNELKKCLSGQRKPDLSPPDAGCTGFVKNNVFFLQATASFLAEVRMTKLYIPLALALAGVALGPLACQDTTSVPVQAKPISIGTCKYQIAPRSEYVDVFAPKNSAEAEAGTTTATPNFRRIRLGLGGDVNPASANRADPSTSVAIAWETDEGISASWVQFGSTPNPDEWKPEDREFGIAYTVPKAEKNLGSKPQQLHEVHLCDLQPSTTYYYRVGGGPPGQEVWSDVLSFRTTPTPGSDEEVTFAITGDSRGNQDNAWQILSERLYKRGDIAAQLFSGDIVDLATFHAQYEEWLDKGGFGTDGKRTMHGQILTLVAMGNHELYNAQFFATVVQPQDAAYERTYDELFFSTNIGPVHVIVLDDQKIGVPGADQNYAPLVTNWLKDDLKAVDRTKTPWVVAVHHRPEWSSSNHGNDADVIKVRNTLSPIWDEYKVNIVFTGHDHNYERTKPLRINNGQPNIGEGTSYVVCAGAGSDGYSNGSTAFTAMSAKYDGGGKIGVYGILKASRSKLSFNAYYLTPDGTDPEIDKFELP
jgi:hypothetical protein